MSAEPKSATWAVAVDGSKESVRGANAAIELVKPGDTIVFLHADTGEERPDPRMSPVFVREYYENKCLEIRSRGLNARFRMVFPRAGKTARDAVVRGSIKINADYIVVATHHRKQKNTNATVIGSTVDASVREAPASALVVKPCSEPVPVQGCKFLVALDPTPGADAAFRRALAMAREGDSVTVLHVVHPVDIDGQEVAQRLRQKVEQIQMPHLDVSFRLVESHHIAETIMKCAKEIEAHVIVVGIEAEVSTGLHLGSVSDAIVRKSDCMVLASQPAEMMGQSEEQLFKRRSCSTLQR